MRVDPTERAGGGAAIELHALQPSAVLLWPVLALLAGAGPGLVVGVPDRYRALPAGVRQAEGVPEHVRGRGRWSVETVVSACGLVADHGDVAVVRVEAPLIGGERRVVAA